ncbi:MAG: ACP S-malonyltransferase, partial [Treponema sp.]|nr:ACP S-malonyltransferase [Treponema sp.]
VRWTDEEDVLASLIKADGGEWKLFEPGPGQDLSVFWDKTAYAENLKCLPINTAEAINGL